MTKRSMILNSALAAALLAAVPAAGHAAEGQFSRTVGYGDLDLTTAEGAETLDKRIKRAANGVCRKVVARGRYMPSLQSACWRRAYAEAKPMVEVAIADARSGSQLAADTRAIMVAGR